MFARWQPADLIPPSSLQLPARRRPLSASAYRVSNVRVRLSALGLDLWIDAGVYDARTSFRLQPPFTTPAISGPNCVPLAA